MRQALGCVLLVLLVPLAVPNPAAADPLEVSLGTPFPSPAFVGYPATLSIQVEPTFSPSTVTGITGRLEGAVVLRPFSLVGHDCPGVMQEAIDNGKTVIEWTGIPALAGTEQINCDVEVLTLWANDFTAQLQMDCDTCTEPTQNRSTAAYDVELPPNVTATLFTNAYPPVGPSSVLLRLENEGIGIARNIPVALFGSQELFATMAPEGVGKCLGELAQDFESVTFNIVQLDPGEVVNCPFAFEVPDTGLYEISALASAESASGLPDPEPADNTDRVVVAGTDFTVNSRFSFSPDANPGDGRCADRDGNCSLRAAVEESNALRGYQRINVPYNFGGYFLGGVTNELVITDPVAITGIPDERSGALPWITRDDSDDAALFLIDTGVPVQTVFYRLDLRGNETTTLTRDGGVLVQSNGALWVRESIISGGDTTGAGGGLRGTQGLRLSGVRFEDNTAADGGGLAVFGVADDDQQDAFLEGVSFENNRALLNGRFGGRGGGAYFINAEVLMNRSSATGNEANQGGGLFVTTRSELNINNSTISDNVAQQRGGGIYHAQGQVNLNFVTLSYNDAGPGSLTAGEGGGIYMDDFISTRIRNSIVAYNTAQTTTGTILGFKKSAECDGTFTSQGHNTVASISQDPDCMAANEIGGDNFSGAPRFSDLLEAPNGTRYRRLLRVNSEVDQAWFTCDDVNNIRQFEDQLRRPRPREGDGQGEALCDKGAVEAVPLSLALDVTAAAGADWRIDLSAPFDACDAPSCDYYLIPVGTSITLTPVTDPGTDFTGWGGACAFAGTAPCTLSSLADSQAVTASFNAGPVEDLVFSSGFED